MSVPLLDLVERSAEPDRVRQGLDRLRRAWPDLDDRVVHGDPGAARRLVAVIAASRTLTDLLERDGLGLAVLAEPFERAAVDHADIVGWKRRELLRIAALDLAGERTLAATSAALSAMARDVLAHALDATARDGERIAVVGMGKLGGNELNYASDVDILLVGEGEPEALERAGRAILDLAGHCFRVDADLRPEGRDGPLVRSVSGFASYWERWAEPWERQSLLRAAPVAGDEELQRAWGIAASEALWGRPFTADDLRHVRALKARAEHAVRQRGIADREVKRGPGGIRDIEFAAQLLQLVHGRVDEELRSPNTLAALDALAQGGYIARDDARQLAEAYHLLRRVEHALQLEDERQTHTVPADRARRRSLARILGYRGAADGGPTELFDRDLAAHRARVRSVHERVWFRPLLESLSGAGPLSPDAAADRLAVFGFTDLERTRQAVEELTRGLTRSSRMMQQVLPLLLDWLSASPDPDLGLLGLRRLATGEARSRALATAFRDSPEVARRLALLLGTSRRLGDILVANPDLIERLPDPERLRTRPPDELVAGALAAIGWRADPDDRQQALQRWQQRHVLGVAARDLFGQASVEVVGADLAALASASIQGALAALDPQVPFVVVALGRLGGAELGYASDLDLAFAHDGTNEADAAEAERLAAGLVRFLAGGTPAERIWEVDTSLRPEGRNGPLTRSLDGWQAYLDRWASTWERQAYLRLRPVAGDAGLGTELARRVEDAIWERPFTEDDAREVRRMKVRIERERLGRDDDPEFHLKLGRGSLSDIEFTVQLLQMRHGVAGSATIGALHALVEAGHLDDAEADILEESYRFCERTRNHCSLVVGAGDALPIRPERITPLARSLGFTVASLRAEYRRVTRRARRVVERRFYDVGCTGAVGRARMSHRSGRDDQVVKGDLVTVHPQVKALLDAMAQMGGPPMTDLSPAEARTMFGAMAAAQVREEVARVDDRLIPGPDGDIPIRVYTPHAAVGESHGVLLWLHGGGWVIGDLETADPTCRSLARRAGCVVVSVDYRLAPEHPAPAALDDCMSALAWTVENFELLGVDASKVAVGGDSAGGNLAALVCQRVRDEFGPEIDFQLLVYPVTDLTLSHSSIDENAEGYFLTKAAMEWFVAHYLGDRDAKDPAVSPLHADDLSGLPPALVITAEMDPLRDEGEAYAARLREAGVPTEAIRYAGQIHGFMGMASMLEDGQDALERAGVALRAALA